MAALGFSRGLSVCNVVGGHDGLHHLAPHKLSCLSWHCERKFLYKWKKSEIVRPLFSCSSLTSYSVTGFVNFNWVQKGVNLKKRPISRSKPAVQACVPPVAMVAESAEFLEGGGNFEPKSAESAKKLEGGGDLESKSVDTAGILEESGDKNESELVYKIIFAAGGTGGHVYPAIAIADAVQEVCRSCSILFAGTRDRMEWTAVPAAGYDIFPILAVQVQRPLASMANILLPLKLAGALLVSLRLVMFTFQPHVVVGTGGYVSVPVCLVAWLFGCQIAILEPNAYPGLANRLIGLIASTVFVAFEESEKYFPTGRCRKLGTPVRATLQRLLPKARVLRCLLSAEGLAREKDGGMSMNKTPQGNFDEETDKKSEEEVIVVLGGSLGARAINEAMITVAPSLLAANSRRHIFWQTGRRYYEEVKNLSTPHPRLHVMPYVEHMETVYAVADLVVARSGAITCSELLVTCTPSILVPSKNVTEDHQRRNAEAMVAAGAAEMLLEDELSGHSLFKAINKLLDDKARLQTMRERAQKSATPNAAKEMAQVVLALGKRHKWLGIFRVLGAIGCMCVCLGLAVGLVILVRLSWKSLLPKIFFA